MSLPAPTHVVLSFDDIAPGTTNGDILQWNGLAWLSGGLSENTSYRSGAGLRFYNAANTFYTQLCAHTSLATNIYWTLPIADGTVGQTMSTNGSGQLGWTNSIAAVGSSTDNGIARWNGTSGLAIKNSTLTLSDANVFSVLDSSTYVNSASNYKISGSVVLAIGTNSVFIGLNAGQSTTGTNNTLIGYQSGSTITTGSNNIIIGSNANVDVATRNGAIAIGTTAAAFDNSLTIRASSVRNVVTGNAFYFDSVSGEITYGALPTTFMDSTFYIYDNADATKRVAFEVSNVTTGTTRTVTVPNANIMLAGNFGDSSNLITGINTSTVSGTSNTSYGVAALTTNVTGANNTAIGFNAMKFAANPSNNVAIGVSAGLYAAATGQVIIGYNALREVLHQAQITQ